MTKPTKEIIAPDTFYRDCFRLARLVLESGYRPDVLLVLWRGGAPIGMVLHEFLQYHGVCTRDIVIKAETYTGINNAATPRVHGFAGIARRIPDGSKVLIVDDIYDTGRTLREVRRLVKKRTSSVKTAVLYHRSDRGRKAGFPDFFARQKKRWIVFPHEMVGLSESEIRRKGLVL